MKPLSTEDVQFNERAASIASSVLGEKVEAACRVEQVTQDQQLATFGVGGVNRGLVKGMMKMNKAMMPRMGADMDKMRTSGLPDRFILAVTATDIHALEGMESPRMIKSWERDGFTAKLGGHPAMTAVSGVPEDRQLLVLYLPIEGAKTKYMKAAANITAQAGSPGQPHRVMLARDNASQAVIERIISQDPVGANIIIGGQSLAQMTGQTPAAADPATQLTQLAALRDQGVLTDDEFTAQKTKILGG
jgi:hypothetical protein